jgi:hypothetical protein
VIGTLCLAACAWRGPQPAATTGGIVPSPTVLAMDRPAFKRVALVAEGSTVQADGRLQVQVTLQNQADVGTAVHVDVEFQGVSGELETVETSWRLLDLGPAASESFTVTSLEAGPSTYTIQLWVGGG